MKDFLKAIDHDWPATDTGPWSELVSEAYVVKWRQNDKIVKETSWHRWLSLQLKLWSASRVCRGFKVRFLAGACVIFFVSAKASLRIPFHLSQSLRLKTTLWSSHAFSEYYRKRGSASYIVREVLLVRERERERERYREREREKER